MGLLVFKEGELSEIDVMFYTLVTELECSLYRADGGNGTAVQSEDCLRINVIAPANASNLPVYIYAQYVPLLSSHL
jgi:hypothetical protein